MSAINLPFSAAGPKRIPTAPELAGGFACGPADIELFNWLNWYATGQIAEVISSSGVTPDDTDLEQLARSLRQQAMNYVATVGGTANALTTALNPVVTNNSQTIGMPLRIKIAADNTGAATLNVGAGALPIQAYGGAPLGARDLRSGLIVNLIGTGTAWRMLGFAYSDLRIKLSGDLTLYIRTDGNDANNGLANTAGGAFATIQAAWNAVQQQYDPNGFTVTLQLGIAGTYVGAAFRGYTGTVVLRGDPANQDNYIISFQAVGSQSWNISNKISTLALVGLKLERASAVPFTDFLLLTDFGGVTTLTNVTLSFTSGGAGSYHSVTYNGGQLFILGPIKLVGSSSSPFYATALSILSAAGSGPWTVTIVGTPTYNNGFVWVDQSRCNFASLTFVGTFVGQRYGVFLNGVIQVSPGGANFFPGTTAGNTASGGQYV